MSPGVTFNRSASGRANFPTTHWSVVVNAGDGSETMARTALETLCRQYWYPLYAFIRRQGHAHHEAEDCTQEFLAQLLATESVARARPERGRFRTFLLIALRNFLTDEWRRAQAAKRGGGVIPIPLEFDTAEQRFLREPADPGLNPEQVFDRSWALEMWEQAVSTLRAEYQKVGKGALFEALASLAWGKGNPETQAHLAASLGLTGPTFNVALHRLRRRFGVHLRDGVAQTVADESEVDVELRHLIAAWGSSVSRE